MSATIFEILETTDQLDQPDESSFVLGSSVEVSAQVIADQKTWSLYAVDLLENLAWFVELPEGLDLAQSAFVYLDQHKTARRLLRVSLDELEEIAQRCPMPERVILAFNTGRCGSTLVSHVLNCCPCVWCLSEPKVFLQLIRKNFDAKARFDYPKENIVSLIRSFRDFMQRRSVSRRMEERPLLTPDEVRRLNPDQAIFIPERQNPLLVHRTVYFQEPTFKKLFEAQKGALPYPPKEGADVQVLAARMEALERKLAERMLVDFVRPEKVKAGTPVEPGPKLAAEIVAREEIKPKPETAVIDDGVPSTPVQAEVAAEPEVHLDALKPPMTISIARMSKFTQKLCELGV